MLHYSPRMVIYFSYLDLSKLLTDQSQASGVRATLCTMFDSNDAFAQQFQVCFHFKISYVCVFL
jgi:hypothetical protein